eukprot:GEMP01039952.1.p1 GENE.GEMP01039952.1~~GEMP01039952.1.p1  ORF type:complete len:387 (+),score=63.25 GEMP01039952.1:577-1737(+)
MGTVQWSSYDCEMPAERLIEATLAQNMIQIWILNIPLREEGKNEVIPLKPLLPNKTGVLKNLKVANATLGSIQCTLQKNAERNPLNCHTYDEILISDFVSRKDFFVDVYETLHIFILSEFLLNSWNIYLGDPPYTKQTELISDKDEHPGLISKRVAHGIAESEELPSLLNLRLQGNVIMNTSAELKQLQDAKIFSAHQAMLTFMEQQTPSVSEVIVQTSKGSAENSQSIRMSKISRSRERRRRSSTSIISRDISAPGATAQATSHGTPLDHGGSKLGHHVRRRSSLNVVVQRTLETEITPDPMEGEAVLLRIALEDSQASYEEDVRKREAKAMAHSKVDEVLRKGTEDELVKAVTEESIKDKRRQQLLLNESKQLEAIMELSKSDF